MITPEPDTTRIEVSIQRLDETISETRELVNEFGKNNEELREYLDKNDIGQTSTPESSSK